MFQSQCRRKGKTNLSEKFHKTHIILFANFNALHPDCSNYRVIDEQFRLVLNYILYCTSVLLGISVLVLLISMKLFFPSVGAKQNEPSVLCAFCGFPLIFSYILVETSKISCLSPL